MPMFPQTSSSSSCAISELPSSRSSLDSSTGIRSAAASRSAGSHERTRVRCASMSSWIVNSPLSST
jgi:hypothetical protein